MLQLTSVSYKRTEEKGRGKKSRSLDYIQSDGK